MINSLIDDIIDFEAGVMSHDQIPVFVQQLIDTGYIDHLQGAYQRLARELIDAGMCHYKEQ